MHELTCPHCTSASYFDLNDYLLMCHYCSATFRLHRENNRKEIFNDHYIVPNYVDALKIKENMYEWLRRMHHIPQNVEKEFFVTDIKGSSLPYWVVSLEVHTVWRGNVERKNARIDNSNKSRFLVESGQFRKSYRWAISARKNICENWGIQRLHEPGEGVEVNWDGFPLDSTFSRGRLQSPQDVKEERLAYDRREYFEFKYSNGLSISGIQIAEDEAIRRAKMHLELYHHAIASKQCDFVVDVRSEIDIAGIQLVHLPFWFVTYIHRPLGVMRHVYKPKEHHAVFEGVNAGIIRGEVPVKNRDKLWINAGVCAGASVVAFLIGTVWHPVFFLICLFFATVSAISCFVAVNKIKNEEKLLQARELDLLIESQVRSNRRSEPDASAS